MIVAEWVEKFAARVAAVDDATSCWLWTGSRMPKGYGRFYPAEGVGLYAHRVAWEIANGRPVPDGLHVLHACDNPPCVRPDHLGIGTRSDNMQDAIAKGRFRGGSLPGVQHPSHKLDDDKVIEIRARYDAGERRLSIADAHGITLHMVKLIGRRLAWRHLP